MSDPMQEIRASFFVECEELLEALQDGLEAMSDGDTDSETINIVFRAVHSIKGGAGAFGLDQLVGFAHKFENALDAVRAGTLGVDEPLVRLFFKCGDLLSDVVKAARDGELLDDGVIAPIVAELVDAMGDAAAEDEAEEEIDFTPAGLELDLGDLDDLDAGADDMTDPGGLPDLGGLPTADGDDDAPALAPAPSETCYKVTFSPEAELYAAGSEPLFLFRLLAELGDVDVSVDATSTLPALDELQQNAALLTWTIAVQTTASKHAIVEVFEFVDGLCELSVEPMEGTPNAGAGDLPSELQPLQSPLPSPESTSAPASEEARRPTEAASDAPAPLPQVEKAPPPAPATQAPIEQEQDAGKPNPKASPKSATVRVDLERIDRLVNLVGELVINQAMLAQSVAGSGLPTNSPVSSGLDEFQHLTRNIQESVMMIRAQPVKSLFQRMGRIVREASTAIGKDARLVTEGESTEIDKTVIERLSDPLTHMIRNAVDHGLESEEERRAVGKPERGTVTLTAAHRSGRVVIEVSDDGGGINRARVQKIAEEKGLISEGQTLSDSEIDNLLFMPGFSTAAEVSNLSGRGVGMDVVKSSISGLGGRIHITSTPGQGTCFSISLPLTLAVLDGMVVQIEKETMVVPLNAIAETLTLRTGEIRALGPTTQVVLVRDTFVPLLDLGAELGYRKPKSDYTGSVALLISQEDGNRAALIVDNIEDQRQVVIKGLQESYGHVPGVAAATILGDGQIALILDPADLIANASGQTAPDPALRKVG
ncbi:MAG: chemotaxis protein CheA [Pseudomonadota bacterium]